jgi:hypothetical protein
MGWCEVLKHPDDMTRDEARERLLEHAYGREMWDRDDDANQSDGAYVWGDLALAAVGIVFWIWLVSSMARCTWAT